MLRFLAWVIGVFVFFALLIAIAPAAIVSQVVATPDLRLDNPQGTVWDGRVDVAFQNKPLGELRWQVSPLRMLYGEVAVDFALNDTDLALQGNGIVGLREREITLQGNVGSRAINQFTLVYDIRMSGEIDINSVKITINNREELEQVRGNIEWDGGPVHFILTNEVHEVVIEPTIAQLSNEGNELNLRVKSANANATVLAFRIELDTGWMHMKAFPAFLEYARLPANYLRHDGDFLFEVSQKII